MNSGPVWRKSSRSAEGTNCIELARLSEGTGLRDSKAPNAGHLTLDRPSLASLVKTVKAL
ncbi:DUF397 domain-containing protein [Actinomadura parmotrematis]|uniref:DUF397 domain-containing protein n=1 Tax=Actinomadura parmotrematis TaxID=2864039 RepID=A0ABS7FPL4_9ACTN|nr:DUF397 domain-containing protein [Actinomadura parmotrematis]MBW8482327.1 DUF397 domain-containing protein [Actinomadura parmotrematis]